MPMVLAGIGFILFTLGKVISLEAVEIMLSVIGGSFVAIAHYGNIKLIKRSAVQ